LVLFCLNLHAHSLLAQTSFSDNPDLKTAKLDQELEKAMQHSDSSAPAAQTDGMPAKKPVAGKMAKPKPLPNLFAKTFYTAPSRKSETIATDVLGFTVVHTPSRKMD